MHVNPQHCGETLEHVKTLLGRPAYMTSYFDDLNESWAKHKDPVAHWIRIENSSAKTLL